jgi:murein DD-endopeptidase MepM/ murein hydrolase activator NlpD
MQHNEENKPKKLRQLFAEKGYYIALVLCIAAVGISGYVLVKALVSGSDADVATEAQLNVPVTADVLPEEAAQTVSDEAAQTAAVEEDAEPVMSVATVSTEDAEAAVRAQAAKTVTWPVSGEVTQPYSVDALVYDPTMDDWRVHQGLDIAAVQGQTVQATQAGTVSAVYTDDYLGTVVVIDHDDDVQTLYANLNAVPTVMAGDEVEAGTVIGAVSDTALGESAAASHLHFAVYRDGDLLDPEEYLP